MLTAERGGAQPPEGAAVRRETALAERLLARVAGMAASFATNAEGDLELLESGERFNSALKRTKKQKAASAEVAA